MKNIPTAEQSVLYDANIAEPPQNAIKLLVLNKYGVLSIGTFDKDSHVAWAHLPKIPKTVKERMKND